MHRIFCLLKGFFSFDFFSSGCSSLLIHESKGNNDGFRSCFLVLCEMGDGFDDGYGTSEGDGDGRGESGYVSGSGWGSGETGFLGDGEIDDNVLSLEHSDE